MWRIAVGTCLFAIAAVALWQAQTIRELRTAPPATVAAAEAQSTPVANTARPSFATLSSRRERPVPSERSTDTDLRERVAALETQVSQLMQNSDYLMSRGQLPLAQNKIAELEQKLLDPNAPERERLQALRLLRRNGAMSDTTVQHALSWLQTATNNGLREDIVEQLGGTTNHLLRGPMMNLATTDVNPDVRQQAVENLRRFLTDPQVEALLWSLARSDSDGGVREEAEEALREGPMTDARRNALQARALDPNSSLDERLIAVSALRESGEMAAEATAALAQFAQTTQDPSERARVFGAFDGSTDPNMKLPLVYGLQDPDPVVRQRAADALSGYKADPAIVEWLKHVASSDADPRVRREASQALNDRR
jgi:HEAT repeat protein